MNTGMYLYLGAIVLCLVVVLVAARQRPAVPGPIAMALGIAIVCASGIMVAVMPHNPVTITAAALLDVGALVLLYGGVRAAFRQARQSTK